MAAVEQFDPVLSNPDLNPTPMDIRNWNWYNFFALWMGMVHNIFNYSVAAGLLVLGMNAWEALFTILVGNLILLGIIVLNAEFGLRFGTPFPVAVRASFGVFGANVAALIRALVAIGWFGIQGYLGAQALSVLIGTVAPGWHEFTVHIPVLGIPINLLAAVVVYWILFGLVVFHGMDAVKRFENWAGPSVLILMLFLFGWALKSAHGFGPIYSQPSHFTGIGFWPAFFAGITGIIGAFATIGLNIPDFTRFAVSRKDHILGQALGLPLMQLFFAILAVTITSATIVVYHHAIWDPVTLIQKFKNPVIVFLGALILMVATLSVNVAANIVSPAYDLSNLVTKHINFKRGALITLIVAFVIMPWRLLVNANTIYDILDVAGAAIAPATAIMIVDFWFIRKQHIVTNQLYSRHGIYRYYKGWNWRALVCLAVGLFLGGAGVLIPAFAGLYKYSWFVGLFAAGILYAILGTVFPVAQDVPESSTASSVS
ncbi:cytosine permease [Sulfobacillus harzensis]|uniref:NCS1 family nucleobase:cation symporter-1 n=1 Tax=Sulfobacillus harzensis TaxID=2729629 RepID=A0A7Y0Q3N4_9FIRM|nr:NCS1 family nucleobase:cation symporter-1 [Sulfobacillus harzensis]